MTATSARYFIVTDDNSKSICDGMTGECFDTEPLSLYQGETFAILAGRLQCQARRCENLNRDDYKSRRQFGEPRAAFADRSAQ